MADMAVNPATTAETKVEEASTRPADMDTTMTDAPVDTDAGAGGVDAPMKEAEQPEPEASEAPTGAVDPTAATSEGENALAASTNDENAVTTNGQEAKKDTKRKSIGKAAEPKGKKLNRKKSIADLHLNCKPGEFWWARTKGNPAWPSLICDEDMLPDTLLSKRPVSAARADGTIRDDFQEGGKNMRDRRFPIMFLGTNEFAWQVNTDLRPLEISEVNEILAKGQTGKVTKKLWQAYEVCAENHDLEYFKNMLTSHYETTRDEERRLVEEEVKRKEAEEAAAAEAEAAKLLKKEKGKRKSIAAVDKDVEMADAEDGADGKKAKGSAKKKRKAQDTGEEKPAKTPKTTLKLKAPKEPQEESTKKSQKIKTKKPSKASDEESSKAEEKPTMTEAELKEKTRKTVLYLRHRLQKGFLTRDSEPKEEEMADMAEHFKSLEEYKGLEPEIIKVTKIHKVLKAIIRLNSIPKDDEYGFKKRSHELLGHWNKALAADTSAGGADGDEAKTNGVGHDEEASRSPEKKEEDVQDEPAKSEAPVKTAHPSIEGASVNEEQTANDAKDSTPSLAQPSVEVA